MPLACGENITGTSHHQLEMSPAMTHPRSLICRSLLALAAIAAFTVTARATNYSPLVGPKVTYTNINESDSQIAGPPAVTTSPAQLFGQPVLSPPGSDILSFMNSSFMVTVANGQFERQDGSLRLDLMPTVPGGALHTVLFDEGGAWNVLGPNGTGSGAPALAEATLAFNDLRITSVNGVPLGTAITVNPTFSVTSSTQTGTAHLTNGNGDVTITSAGGNAVGLWDITANFDLDAALASHNLSGRVTGVSMALDDILLGTTTSSDGLTIAAIDKKHVIITPTATNPVPEPSTIILGLFGGVGLLFTQRQWRKASQV